MSSQPDHAMHQGCTPDEATTSSAQKASPDTSSPSSSKSSECSSSKRPDIDLDNFPTSRVEYYGAGRNSCGYCKKDGERTLGRKSYDMKSYKLLPQDYQDLLDRGWRRSGSYCYHPLNNSTCCPNYPIMCKPFEFKLTRSQRKSIQKVNNFLITGHHKGQINFVDYNPVPDYRKCDYLLNACNQLSNFDKIKTSSKARHRRFVESCNRKVKLQNIDLGEAIKRVRTKAIIKSERRHYIGSLEDYLFPTRRQLIRVRLSTNSIQSKHRLEIHLNHVKSKSSEAMRSEEHKIIQRYQKKVHKEEADNWDMERFCDFLVESPIQVQRLSNFDFMAANNGENEVNSPDSLSVQEQQPQDDDSYILVRPPELPTAFGTYHCTYRLDGKLIAVGVLDVLPSCLTTVYFFYDPDYEHLNLGIYSALVEISMVRQLGKHYCGPAGENKLVNYHMGFYVHECKKMHYKTRFKPSYLLCSETCQYVPTEICLNKLRDRKYARFSIDPALSNYSIYTEEPTVPMMLEVPIISPVTGVSDSIAYIIWVKNALGARYADLFIENFLLPYIRLVGEALLPRLTLQVDAVHRALTSRCQKNSEDVIAKNVSEEKAKGTCSPPECEPEVSDSD